MSDEAGPSAKPDAPVEQRHIDLAHKFVVTEAAQHVAQLLARFERDRTADLEKRLTDAGHENDAVHAALLEVDEQRNAAWRALIAASSAVGDIRRYPEITSEDQELYVEQVALARAALADGEKEGTK